MGIQYILLFVILVSCFWQAQAQAQVEKELRLNFKQGESELDAATKINLEKSLQAFAENSPIEVIFYREATLLENGQFNNIQTNKKNQAVLVFLKSKNVKIKLVRTENIEDDGLDNPNSVNILLTGVAKNQAVAYTNVDTPKSNNPAPISPQVEKELRLNFKEGENELDVTTQINLENLLQTFAENSPIEVIFYKKATLLENGQFNNMQINKQNQAVLAFLKSKNVNIKFAKTENIEDNGLDNPNSVSILLLRGVAENQAVASTNVDTPKSNNPAPIPPQLEKPEPSDGAEYFPSEADTVTFERAAEIFLAPTNTKKVRPMYH